MTKSDKLFEKAKNYMPGGVNSPVRAFGAVNRTPLFIKKAKGAYIFDVDNNKYIDYVCSWGPQILGHAHPRVIKAVKKACNNGLTYGAPTEKETILAELIKKCVPSMEMIRLVNSGTEATMSAIRVARGYTKKDKIIKFIGCYHGHSDGLLMKAGSGLLTNSIPNSDGIPKDYAKYTLLAKYNDENSVKQLMELYGNKIACIIVEPIAANMGVIPPKNGFLEFLRKITKQYNALLIFDEVITGFRVGIGGAQEYYKVTPDLTTFGKIVGGGMPLAVYGGKKEIMTSVAPVGNIYQAGTLSGNPIATTAGIETLKILIENKEEIYSKIDENTAILENAYKKIGLTTNRIGSLMSAFFTDKQVSSYDDVLLCDTDKFANYFNYMLNNGIYVAPSQFEAMFISFAHSKEIIEHSAKIISEYKIN